MNQRLKEVMIARYNAVIEDSKNKIKCYSDQENMMPEHPDITLEVDKLLETTANAEEKLAIIELHYGKNETEKTIL